MLEVHVALSLIGIGAGLATVARYGRRLAGAWRAVYVVTAVLSLYLNVFVGVAQAFDKVAALHRLAPTQSEAPFAVAQLLVLLLFIGLGALAVRRFHPPAGDPPGARRALR